MVQAITTQVVWCSGLPAQATLTVQSPTRAMTSTVAPTTSTMAGRSGSNTKSSRTSAVPGSRGRSSLRLWILLIHHIEHATGRRSTRPIVDNVGDLARINFLWAVAWLRTIAVRRS